MHMRASLVFASIVALLLPFAAADKLFRGGSKTSAVKSDAQHDVIAGRQFRVKRDNGDSCVSMSGKEFAERVNLVPDPAFDVLTVDTCKKNIETWLANDPNGQALTRLIGIDAARTAIYRLFLGSPTIEKRQEVSIVAAIEALFRLRRSLPLITLAQAKQTCKINESVCGIPGSEDDTQAFECIDTRSSLDHCGGCVVPHPFYEPDRITSKGVECGRLPHVISAQCKQSKCIISQCKEGYELSSDKTECVSVTLPEGVFGAIVSPIFHPVMSATDQEVQGVAS